MRVVALTGGIACGKTTVAEYLKSKYHITVIDSDQIAHDLQKPGTPVFKKIVATFGQEVVSDDGTLNRKRLGEIVFKDPAQRRKLDRIIHPQVFRQLIFSVIKAWITRQKVIVLDIPLFFEVRIPQKYFNDIVTVAISPEKQVERLMARNQLSEEAASNRLKAQLPIEQKCSMSTTVLRNETTVEDLKAEVDDLVKRWGSERLFRTYFPDPIIVAVVVVLLIAFVLNWL